MLAELDFFFLVELFFFGVSESESADFLCFDDVDFFDELFERLCRERERSGSR